MAQHYDASLSQLCEQIIQYDPTIIPILDHMKSQCGVEIAYYAAFVIVCIRARQEKKTTHVAYTPTTDELQNFTFFSVPKHNPVALELFEQLLMKYHHEQTTQTRLPLPPFGTARHTSSAADSTSAEVN